MNQASDVSNAASDSADSYDGLNDQCPDYATLSGITPDSAGQRIFLREYTVGTGYGGGQFQAVNGAGTEDNGVTCVVSSTWYWKRVGDPHDYDVTHFGAVPGTSDSVSAINRMFAWSAGVASPVVNIGVQFPPGNFSISTLDLSGTYKSHVRISGKFSPSYGYNSATKLTLIGAAGSIAITVQARNTEITNLWIYGQYDSDSLLRHFFKNTVTAGQYVRVNNIYLTYVGRGFQLQDTLDCKFDQFYASHTYDNIFRILASGTATGSWDHSTAVELSNFNIQNHLGASDQAGALFIPNCGQSLIHNGWIEHTTYPGNITLGQWNIQSLSMETCTNPLYAIYSKIINTLFSNPNNAGIDTTTDMTVNYQTGEYQTRTLSAYERGTLDFNSHTITANAAVRQQWLASYKKISNVTASAIWVSVGHVYLPSLANHVVMRFLGRTGYSSGSSTSPISSEAVVSIQNRGSTSATVSWECPYAGPLSDVKYTQPYNTDTNIYVQVPAYSVVGIFIESTGPTRNETGAPVNFSWDMATVEDITSISNITDAPSVSSVGTTTAGFVFDGENSQVRVRGSHAVFGGLDNILMVMNGTTAYIPYQNGNATKFQKYTYSTLPAASSNSYSQVFCTAFKCADGNSYPAQMVFSDGTNWRPSSAPSTYLTSAA